MKTIAIDKGDGWLVSDLLIEDDTAKKLETQYKEKKYKVLIMEA